MFKTLKEGIDLKRDFIYIDKVDEKGIVYSGDETFKVEDFEEVYGFFPIDRKLNFYIPQRATIGSAGYDLKIPEQVNIAPKEIKIVPLNIKAKIPNNCDLDIYIRSSLSLKGLKLTNQVGIVDADYYNNEKNDGNIGLILENTSDKLISLKDGDRVAQGILRKYETIGFDFPISQIRTGGMGSSGR